MLDADVTDILHGHIDWWSSQEKEQELFQAMYETRFWAAHGNGGVWARTGEDSAQDGQLPVQLEASRLWVWLNTFTSHLFLRQPRTVARLPGVLAPRAGRPRNMRELPERVEALIDEWLSRAEVQELATYAYQLALMSGAAAFKVGMCDEGADVLDRVWLSVMPRWECVWDDRAATPEQQLYRGHLFHIVDRKAEELVGAKVPDNWERSRLPKGYLLDETDRGNPEDKQHPSRMVRLLEFYDFEAEQQRFYLVSNDARTPALLPFGKAERIPYELPNGRCACPIYPVVLDNVPSKPMQGIPSARRVWRLTAEDNYLGSYVASAARQRMALKGVYNGAKLADDKVQAWWRSSENLELLKVDGGDLEQLVRFIDVPPIDPTIADAKAWVDSSRRDTEGLTPQMQGQQGEYLTAAEAELVAEGGEATAGQIASRMVAALAKAAELVLTIVATHQPKVTVVRGSETTTLTAKDMRLPWRLKILDAGTTPSREASRKKEWMLIEPQIEKLVTLASGAASPGVEVPEAIQRYCRAALKQTRQLYDLPDDFSPESLLDGTEPAEAPEMEDADELPPDPMAGAMPPPELAAPGMAPLPPMPPMAAPPPAAPPPPPPANVPIVDPLTGMQFDPTTGAIIDPVTGQTIPLPPDGAFA